ncbi:adenosylcobinamide-GDP ribazoletransferase [Heliophilum fasciatum]|nr:adenosylcobinamide-GDP ribazoletransferase [Heliophilum fasciatum]MCW2278543.1 adenosylcobinamide-GDP ribazoletransferase [Heliophilum fasciatum]
MSKRWLRLRLAISFFSRLPVGDLGICPDEDFGRSFGYLPAVALILGGVLALAAWLLGMLLPPLVWALLILAYEIYLSGGTLLDGFMDTMDGIFSGRSPERILTIMRDSRVGAHAVVAVVLLLMVKGAALFVLCSPESGGAVHGTLSPSGAAPEVPSIAGWSPLMGWYELTAQAPLYLTLLWMPLVGRWAVILGMCRFPYARERGMASLFHQYLDRRMLPWATLVVLLVTGFLAGVMGMLVFAVIALLMLRMGQTLTGQLGGLTGDIYGAMAELSEVMVLLGVLMLQKAVG